MLDFHSNLDLNKEKFPTTRYRGSKRKLIYWLYDNVKNIEFESVLDAFGGTGTVSYLFKLMGKSVTYNDYLKFNYWIGKSFIENQKIKISCEDISQLLNFSKLKSKNKFIFETFKDIYFLPEENLWLDNIIQGINIIPEEGESIYKKAIALNALFQSCLIKRPYNLFHRKNLNLRLNEVSRTFGNKITWDKSFESHFVPFIHEQNSLIFDNGKICKALNKNILSIENEYFDLVYLDPPYLGINSSKEDYLDYYHFLEGICNYNCWEELYDYNKKNLGFHKDYKESFNKKNSEIFFSQIIEKFSSSKIVISYKDPGFPSIEFICNLLKKHNKKTTIKKISYNYALNKNKINKIQNNEVLIIGI